PDVLPDPFAILVHGITPQTANSDGISEAELISYFTKDVAKPGTIFVGYNSIRFDDKFMSYSNYRSLRDPYDWYWRDNRSRWDLLDPIRMMRALRPDGLEWPFASDGKPTVSLSSMTAVNGIEHSNAHDALADIEALIELAQKFNSSQPKLFKYLLENRGKKQVAEIVGEGKPFVYTSGKYSGEYLKTTLAVKIIDHPTRGGAVVYDLRTDPEELFDMSSSEIARRWQSYEPSDRLPLKTIMYNHCPAVASASVLIADPEAQARIKIDIAECQKNLKKLKSAKDFTAKIFEVIRFLDKEQQTMFGGVHDVDEALYDHLWTDEQQKILYSLSRSKPEEIIEATKAGGDDKIAEIGFRFVARNYPKSLTAEQAELWEQKRAKLLTDGGEKSLLAQFATKLAQAAETAKSEKQQYLLTELQLYAESIIPYTD
nr:exodeoxyribonuclease I [bacterium]